MRNVETFLDHPNRYRWAGINRNPGHVLRAALSLAATTSLAGCEPMVDIAGVYFPGWLVSTVVGVAAAYGIVFGLGRSSYARRLADSGLFFVSLVVVIALIVWWLFFSGF